MKQCTVTIRYAEENRLVALSATAGSLRDLGLREDAPPRHVALDHEDVRATISFADAPTIERRSRPTICDGLVVEFATGFAEEPGAFGPTYRALGPFCISASRNAIVVHHASLDSEEDLVQFRFALDLAAKEFELLR